VSHNILSMNSVSHTLCQSQFLRILRSMKDLKISSIGEAVRHFRKLRKMTLGQVADQIDGYDTGGLSRFERGEQGIAEEKLRQIAVILEVPMALLYAVADREHDVALNEVDQLLHSEDKSFVPDFLKIGPSVHARVPLISWVKAGEWTDIGQVTENSNEVVEWRDTTAIVSAKAFALRVEGDSMVNPYGSPSIPEGSVVIVDPDRHADNGSIVVALLDETNQATLKKLVVDGPVRYLKPLNPAYKAIEINGNCTIVGVVRKVEIDL